MKNEVDLIKASRQRVLKTPGGKAFVAVRDDEAIIAGGQKHSIKSSDAFGNIIKGPTSIVASPDEIRIAGLWRLSNELTSTVPSTIMTPSRVLFFDMPYLAVAKEMSKSIAVLSSLLV